MNIGDFVKSFRNGDINPDLIKKILEKATEVRDADGSCVIQGNEYIGSEKEEEFKILKCHYQRLIDNGYIDGKVDIVTIPGPGGVLVDIETITNDGIKPKGVRLLEDIQNGNDWSI